MNMESNNNTICGGNARQFYEANGQSPQLAYPAGHCYNGNPLSWILALVPRIVTKQLGPWWVGSSLDECPRAGYSPEGRRP